MRDGRRKVRRLLGRGATSSRGHCVSSGDHLGLQGLNEREGGESGGIWAWDGNSIV